MNETDIAFVQRRWVWDSRGRPTVEADVRLEGGRFGRMAEHRRYYQLRGIKEALLGFNCPCGCRQGAVA